MDERGITSGAYERGSAVGAWLGSFPENLLFWVPMAVLVLVVLLLCCTRGHGLGGSDE